MMTSWMITFQRATSAFLWLCLATSLVLALAIAVGSKFAHDRSAAISMLLIVAVIGAGVLATGMIGMPLLAWTRRGGAPAWLDDVADRVGGDTHYASIFFPTVPSYLDGEVAGRPFRIVLHRRGGILGAWTPGGKGLGMFGWYMFVRVSRSEGGKGGDEAAKNRISQFPGVGRSRVDRAAAHWSGRLTPDCDPASVAGLVRDLAALAG